MVIWLSSQAAFLGVLHVFNIGQDIVMAWNQTPQSINLTTTAAMAGGTQLVEGALLTVVVKQMSQTRRFLEVK